MTWGSRPSQENSNLINSQGKITQNTCKPHTQVKHLLPEILSTYATQTGLCIFRSNLHQCCPLFLTSAEINMLVEDDGLLPLVKLMVKCKSVPAYLMIP